MIKYSLYLSEAQLEELKKLSDRRDLAVSELIRRAIDEFLDQQEQK